jgi:hypothetical protein
MSKMKQEAAIKNLWGTWTWGKVCSGRRYAVSDQFSAVSAPKGER